MRDPFSGGHAAGKRDDLRVPVRHQRLARFLAITGDDVDNPFGEFLKRYFGEQQSGERCEFRRLDDHRIAGHQRRRDFPGHQKQRVVPRHDADDHAVRFLHHEIHLMTLHRWNHAAGFVTPDFGVVIKARRDPLDFVHVFDERLAALLRQNRRNPFAVLSQIARGGVQQLALFDPGNKAPIILRLQRGQHRPIGIFRTSTRNFVDNLFGRGILDLESLTRKSRYKLAVNEHFAHRS